jgi:hypothetical protein
LLSVVISSSVELMLLLCLLPPAAAACLPLVTTGGDDEAARGLAANDFKYWELMRRAAARGCTLFDYGRSKRGTGPFDFKKNWGFTPTPLAYEFRLYNGQDLPQHNPNIPKYQRVIETWRRLPRAVVNRLGPLIVRNLG